ncbi:MAG: AMP-binding protein [Actinomycetota bacterium]|nr:AMP-binding protein [Actinomycetota bacterium]
MTITSMLATAAASRPGSVFLRTAEGELSYGETEDRVRRVAGGLARMGIRAGSPVVLIMRNSTDQVVVWFALARLGALHIPLNPGLIGQQLEHALRVTAPTMIIADHELLRPVAATIAAAVPTRTTLVRGAPEDTSASSFEDLVAGEPADPAPHAVDDLDVATLLFTSGTTGVSKACELSHRYLARQGEIHARQFGLRADDVLYCPFPLFHIDAATLTVVAALAAGATAALGERFSTSRYWDEVRRFDASVINFMGATLTMLWKLPASPADTDHRVRLAWGVPMPEWKDGWEARFGFPLLQVYGLTDAGVPVYDPIDGTQRSGACGRVIDEYEIRISNSEEILVRGREPGLIMNGYHAMLDATADAIDADGWVHTGDRGRLDPDGFLTFLGRSTDSIRRRGENISAHEVEQAGLEHPDVIEVTAIGRPSELTEEDVQIFVVLRKDANLTAAELHQHYRAVAPRHLTPRYITFLDQLPKTPTEKVEKFKLARTAHSWPTWDSDANR